MFTELDVSAVAAAHTSIPSAGAVYPILLEWEWVPGSVSTQTVKIRVGASTGNLAYLNGISSGRLYGGAGNCSLVVEEIKA